MRTPLTAPTLRLVACLAVLCSTSGCAKASMADSSSNYAGQEAYAEQSSVELTSAFGYDPLVSDAAAPPSAPLMAPEPEPEPSRDYADEDSMGMDVELASVESRGGVGSSLRGAIARGADRRQARREAKSARGESGGAAQESPAPPAEDPNPEIALAKPDDPGKVASGEEKSEEAEAPEEHGRQIIYTAAMVVAVHDVDEATELAEDLPQKFGGFVQQRRRGVIIMKIPAAKLQAIMVELAAYGIVQARQLQAQDVTAEFTDLQSRIRVLRDTQTQLLNLLKQAKNVEETLKVRQALDEVTMQLEVALGRMRQLSESISFSTLTIQFSERRPQQRLPSSNDPFRWVDQLGVEGTEWR